MMTRLEVEESKEQVGTLLEAHKSKTVVSLVLNVVTGT